MWGIDLEKPHRATLNQWAAFTKETILNYVKLNSFWTFLSFGVNGTLVYRPYRGCVTLRKHIYHLQTTKSQLLVEQIYIPSIESNVTNNKNELWKTFRLTSFKKPISIRFHILYRLRAVPSSDLVWEVHASASEEWRSRETPLPSRVSSHARGPLRVSGVLLDGPRKKRDCS